MGNSIDPKKEKDLQQVKNQISDLSSNQGDQSPDYLFIFDHFDQKMDPCLNQLLLWSLTDIRLLYEKFRRKTYFPLIDRNLFNYLLNLSKQNSTFIFAHLTQVSKEPYITIYELLAILILTSYSNHTDKLKLLFNVFDFRGAKTLEFNEWHASYKSVISAICKLTGNHLPSKSQIEKDARFIFIRIDVAPYDQKLSFAEIKEWSESNMISMKILQKFEPNYQIMQKFTTLLGFKPFHEDQIDEIIYHIVNIIEGNSVNAIAKIKEKINLAQVLPKELKSEKSYMDNSVDKTQHDSVIMTEDVLARNNSKISSSLQTRSDSILGNSTKIVRLNDSKKSTTIISIHPLRASLPSMSKNLINIYDESSLSIQEPLKLPKIPNLRSVSPDPLLMLSDRNDDLKQKRRRELSKTYRTKRTNVIITNGSSITRTDAEKLRSYFNSLAQGRNTITLPLFVKAFSKSLNLQKVSASIFSFLDKNSHGEVTFSELIQRLYPSLTKDQLNQIIEWTHNPMYDHNYHGEETDRKKKANQVYIREVPKDAIKRMKHIFDLFDEEKKGWVSLDNLMKNFKNLFTPKEVEDLFIKHDKDKDGKLSLQEFIEVILPPDYKVDPLMIEKCQKKAFS